MEPSIEISLHCMWLVMLCGKTLKFVDYYFKMFSLYSNVSSQAIFSFPPPLISLTLCRPLRTEMLTMTHWLCDIRIDLCVGSGVLQRLNTTHAAQMTFRTCASEDSAGYRFHPEMSLLTDTRCWSSRLLPSCGISRKSAAPWLLIWKHGEAHPITVMIGIPGSAALLVEK